MRRMITAALMAGAAMFAATGAPAAPPMEAAEAEPESPPPAPPRIISQRDATRLRGLEGITLQWLGWDRRGTVNVLIDDAGIWHLHGEQTGDNAASLAVDGIIREIGADHFILEGTVTIINTPDEGRTCEGHGTWHFAATQKRQYYRLRQFEWCDGLTDYVDLYF